MKVRWTPAAEQDREDIRTHIAVDNPLAAIGMDELLGAAAERLADYPHLGRPGHLPGTRELHPHRSYRMCYRIVDDTVWVVAVVHTSRQWPPLSR